MRFNNTVNNQSYNVPILLALLDVFLELKCLVLVGVSVKKMVEVDFYFDIVCPFAYLGSTQINKLCAKYNVVPKWKPVLLAGLYEASKAPQGKKNSATTVMSPAKRLYNSRDALWQRNRCGVQQKYPPGWSTRTLPVQRLLTAMKDDNNRMKCAQKLYHDLWVDNIDITQTSYLTQIASQFGMDINIIQDPAIKAALTENTKNATERYNMFGVPTVIVRLRGANSKEHVFWGIDRFPLINMLLRDKAMLSSPKLLLSPSSYKPISKNNTIEFVFDFASPWSFLGYMRLNEFKPYADKIIFKPVVLGALFVAAGTKGSPIQRASAIKARYMNMDFNRWFDCCGVKYKMNSAFPIRTILPLRVFIIDNRTIDCIFKGCWQSNVNIGDKKQLRELLNRNGFDGDGLIKRASTDTEIKQILKDNSSFAVKKGMFGVPCYVVNGDYDRFCWGQDRMYFVKDMCCGWKPPIHKKSNL